ncbi:MAG: helix-hairpin-helix domain-containing protein [Armatimonadota bacterium]
MPGPEFNSNQKLALYVLIGLSAVGLSVAQVRHSLREPADVVLREPGEAGSTDIAALDSDTPPKAPDRTADSEKVVFQVAGCVRCPGVYSLPEGRRVIDAIKAAGGAKSNADTEAINLAARITDGSRIYVPAKGDPAQNAVAHSTRRLATSGPGFSPSNSQVNINTAGLEELDRLPGVGPATARKILDYRSRIGRFTSVDQLMEVKGIGPKKLEEMRPFVTL